MPRKPFPSPRHQHVHDLLRRLISEGTAAYFADACEIPQQSPPLQTTTHLVGHLLREIESSTRQVLRSLPGIVPRPKKNQQEEHLAQVEEILRALSLDEDAIASTWRFFARGEDALHRHAHRDDLGFPRQAGPAFEERLARFVDVLFVLLDGAEAVYARQIHAVRNRITPKPSREDYDAVAAMLAPGVAGQSPIFECLPPSWLLPLRERGVFKSPPGIRQHDEGYSFPSWPAAAYLVRIAPDLAADVAETIEGIPSTDNEAVYGAFLEAGARMRGPEAARVARHLMSRVAPLSRWDGGYIPRGVGALFERLLEDDELDTALSLLRMALRLERPAITSPRQRLARMDDFSYGVLVKNTVPPLAAKASERAIAMLHELLDALGEDADVLRRGPIEHGPLDTDAPVDILSGYLRNVYLARAAPRSDELRACVAQLEARLTDADQRLALYLLRVHGRMAPELTVARLTDARLLASAALHDDIARLLREQLGHFGAEDQDRVITALRRDASVAALRPAYPPSVDDDQVQRFARHRLLKWFHALRDARPPHLEGEYETLIGEFGVPEYARRRPGAAPARRAHEMLAMADEELLEFLLELPPSDLTKLDSSREALGPELQKAAEQDPARFIRLARDLRSLTPSLIANVLHGIQVGASAATTKLDWPSVLDLIEWVAAKPMEGARGPWTWPQRTSAGVAADIVAADEAGDGTITQRAWQVVRALMDHPDPGPAAEDHGGNVLSFALNNSRGQALRAAVRIGSILRERGMAAAAEPLRWIIEAVAARTDEDVEPSALLRASIADLFTHLYLIDPALAETLAPRLFPTRAASTPGREMAWAVFLRRNEPHPKVYAVVREAYEAAVDRIATTEAEAAGALGDHLIHLGVYGAVDITNESSPLRRFVETGPVPARHVALDHLGHAVYNDDSVDEVVLGRLRALWDAWAAIVIARDDAGDLTAFGWWFAARHFDAAWSMATLERTLGATAGRIDWSNEVIERLAGLAGEAPEAVARCLRLIIEADDAWQVIANRKELRGALQALHATPAADGARKLASRLVARDWHEFGDLT